MRALVVFESMYGNTEDIANAVRAGLSEHMQADSVEVGHAPTEIGDDVTLLVLGAPTHAFGMSRRRTRDDAAARPDHPPIVSTGIGVREWLAEVAVQATRLSGAVFDTKVRHPKLPGSAGGGAQRRMKRLGVHLVEPPETFWVEGTTGPLVAGEVERARAWAEQLAAKVAGSGPDRQVS